MKISALLLFSLVGSLFAQQPAADTPAAQPKAFGQVTGRVFCKDTGEPARFAGVQLLAEKQEKEPAKDPAVTGKDADLGKLMVSAFASVFKGSDLTAITKLDGTFSLDKVPAGTYYVIPQFAGYLSPINGYSQKERLKPNDATLAEVEKAAQKIVVGPGESANVTVELERGATLSGKVTYDDGSPVATVTVVLLVRQNDGKWKELGSIGVLPVMTDDLGRFRFSGVPAGQYAVKAVLPVTQAVIGIGPSAFAMHLNTGDMLTVYSGGAMREKDLKAIEVTTGEPRDDVEVIFPLSGLHTISGSVVAKSDNHAVNAGSVELDDLDTKAQLRLATVGEDGSFRMNYVPDGTYVLKATGADMKPRNGGGGDSDFSRLLAGKPLKEYGSVEQTLMLKSDTAGLSLRLPEAAADEAKSK